MPLRIPMTAHHPDGPAPLRRRRVLCPGCRVPFEISRRAITVRCPRCGRPLAFDDLSLRRLVEGEVVTMGHVKVRPSGRMHGKLIAGSVAVQGELEGELTCFGTLEITAGARVRGRLHARSLSVRRGSDVTAQVRIHPEPTPTPVQRPRRLEALQPDTRPHAGGLPAMKPFL